MAEVQIRAHHTIAAFYGSLVFNVTGILETKIHNQNTLDLKRNL